MRWVKAIAALVALVALAVGVPVLLLTFVGSPWPAETEMNGPLGDQALIKLVSIAVWILWAQTLWCVIAEAVAVARAQSTFAVPKSLADLKERIHRFREEMLERCDSETDPEIVYQLCIQLFPLSQAPK